MPTSPNLLLEHVVQGQFQKEVTVNQAVNNLERKITNGVTVDIAGAGTKTLSDDETRDMLLEFIGIQP